MLGGTAEVRHSVGGGSRIGTLERPDRHESQPLRPLFLESVSSSGYDGIEGKLRDIGLANYCSLDLGFALGD